MDIMHACTVRMYMHIRTFRHSAVQYGAMSNISGKDMCQ